MTRMGRESAGRPAAAKERKVAMPDRRAAPQPTMLRQRAENFLRKADQDIGAMPVQDVQQLVHELQVYQIELEMQNEALCSTQQELETSRDRYSALYDFAPVGYLTLDRAGMILEANLTAARLLGIARRELLHQRLTDFIVPADQDTFYHHRQQTVATHMPQACELAMQRQDGTAFFVRLESLVELEKAGGSLRWGIALSDVTAQRHLEAQLREAQKMEAIGTLAGGIAHDFNNILQIIIGFTGLAQGMVAQASPAWQPLQHVLTAGQRAKELVQQMLDFSRHHAPQRQPLQFHLLLHETLQLLRAALPSTVDLRAFLNTTSGTVLANPAQLQQVLMNLASNADYAMRTTGGVLEVHLDEVDITPHGAVASPPLPPGPYLRLTIRDTGVGMTPEVMARIFEPFFTTKGTGQGTGLGLAVVYGIISRHGGTITVASTPEQGTTFTIYLPRVAEAPPVRDRLAEPLPAGTERLLFVDDEDALSTLARETLIRLGYDVTVSTSSLDALAAFCATPQGFDLVITDQTMPAMTGETLVRELWRIRPDIPIILCTGYSPLIDAERAAVLGIDAFLPKPVESATLAHTIRQVMTQRKGAGGCV
jgi:two-component system, cell cycle sensor histidine kinase and response regulator CckA